MEKESMHIADGENGYVYYRNTGKTGMLYILKLVCLLQKYEKNGMLYI